MIKRNIIYISIIFIVGVILFFIYLKVNNYPSKLGTQIIDGQTYKTTGSIPYQDSESREYLSQFIKLINMGNMATDKFMISVNDDGEITVLVYKPYEQNKKDALVWFQDNGYTLISENNIIFTYSP